MPLPDVPDTYRLTVFMQQSGQEIVNVFYFRDTAVSAFDPVDVAQGFWDNVKAAWRGWIASAHGAYFVRVECEFLSGAHPFGVYAIPAGEQAGTRVVSGDPMPTTLAAVIKLNVATRVTRPGSKRMSGLWEADVTTLNLVAGVVTLLQTLATAFADPFVPTGEAINVTPVVVGYPTPFDPSVRVQDIVSGTASPYVGHQVSRDARP